MKLLTRLDALNIKDCDDNAMITHFKTSAEIHRIRWSYFLIDRNTLYLPTTKHFFNLVAEGYKTTEYRKASAYYNKLFLKASHEHDLKYLVLHYRQSSYLHCKIDMITLKKRPPELIKSQFITTDYCWAIDVSSVANLVIRQID